MRPSLKWGPIGTYIINYMVFNNKVWLESFQFQMFSGPIVDVFNFLFSFFLSFKGKTPGKGKRRKKKGQKSKQKTTAKSTKHAMGSHKGRNQVT
jgi:hypothetical protein